MDLRPLWIPGLFVLANLALGVTSVLSLVLAPLMALGVCAFARAGLGTGHHGAPRASPHRPRPGPHRG